MIPHHVISGDGPWLVLANSLGSTHAMWDPVAAALAEHFRVVRFDTRGHGDSDAAPDPYTLADLGHDALELLDQLGIERTHWAGLSVGGMTGLWLAINAPERIDRLVGLCTSAKLGPPELWQERIDTVHAQGTGSMVDGSLQRWITPAFRDAHPETVELITTMINRVSAEGYAGVAAAIRDMDLLDELPRISAPTLIIAGAQDPATPPREHGQLIADRIEGARLEVLDPGAHVITLERPEDVTRLIIDHLES
jgi:3-oxoadipate enol-lactonase